MINNNSIIFILPSLYAGGAERVLLTLFKQCPSSKKKLVVLNKDGGLQTMASNAGSLVNLNVRHFIYGFWPLYRALWQERPAAIISTMAHMNFMVLLLKPFLPARPKIIVREANIPSSLVNGVRLKFLVRWGYKILYPFADRVVSPSQKIIDEFQHYLRMPTDKHVLLRNPVDVPRIRSLANENFIAPGDDVVHFIAVGRLHYQKGFDRLIAECVRLNIMYNWKLTICGEGKERAALEAQIKRAGLQDKIVLTGPTDNPWGLMAAADALLLPSRWEGLPNVVLESLAVGTPVIAMSEAGGIGEIAALAPAHVTITETMTEFREIMQGIVPGALRAPRHSALPDEFSLDMVMRQFGAMVSEVLTN